MSLIQSSTFGRACPYHRRRFYSPIKGVIDYGGTLIIISFTHYRVEGLLTRGAMKPDDRPLWFDVYRAFPPVAEPKFARPKPEIKPIRPILYQEDILRAYVLLYCLYLFHSLLPIGSSVILSRYLIGSASNLRNITVNVRYS